MNTSSYSAESILRSCLQTAEKQDGLPCKNIVFSNSSRIRRKRKFYYIIFFGVCVGGFKNFFGFLEIWCEMLEMEGHGAGNFAVCGQRLRGHVPSKRVCFASRRMQIAPSDFSRDERKNGGNPLWISEYFPEISRKRCKQDVCE